jgi:hypothetical protein
MKIRFASDERRRYQLDALALKVEAAPRCDRKQISADHSGLHYTN